MPSPSFTSADLLHVGKSVLIGKLDATQLLAPYDRYTRGLCQHLG